MYVMSGICSRWRARKLSISNPVSGREDGSTDISTGIEFTAFNRAVTSLALAETLCERWLSAEDLPVDSSHVRTFPVTVGAALFLRATAAAAGAAFLAAPPPFFLPSFRAVLEDFFLSFLMQFL